MKRTITPTRWITHALAPAALAAVAISACGSSSHSTATSLAVQPRVVITSVKGDTRSALLAAMYARVLSDNGFRVAIKDPVDLDQAGVYAALKNGDFTLIPSFTHDFQTFLYSQPGAPSAPTTVVPAQPATTRAPVTLPPLPSASTTTATATTTATTTTTTTTTTATSTSTSTTTTTTTTAAPTTSAGASTTTSVHVVANGRTATEQITAIKAALASTVTVGNAASAEDKQVIACSAAAIKANSRTQLVTLTDLAANAPIITLGGSAAFMADKEFGMGAFTHFYGGSFKANTVVEDAGLAAAVKGNTADCFAMSSMNPVITTEKMTVLADDKVMVPANAAFPLIASAIAVPTLIGAIDTLNASLTTPRLNQMLNEVTASGNTPSVVANAFMNTL